MPVNEEDIFENFSPAAATTIIKENRKNVLTRPLWYDSMACIPMYGDVPLEDVDIIKLRIDIENKFHARVHKNIVGLRLHKNDLFDAVVALAHDNSQNPLTNHLNGLPAWDGIQRLCHLPTLMGAENTELNQTLLRKWFISLVARGLNPGCKVDTALILVGKQGVGKSTFFKTIATPQFFTDSPIDIHSQYVAYMLRATWIIEWAELESYHRARDMNAVKQFMTVESDTFTPKWNRFAIKAPRSCVFGGTTNQDEFLYDDEDRRFWPLRVGNIQIDQIALQRDQLLAEAIAAYRAGEIWHLTNEQPSQLAIEQKQFKTMHPWDEPILAYLSKVGDQFTISDVLRFALFKPEGQWTQADVMKISSILKRLGCIKYGKINNVNAWGPPK